MNKYISYFLIIFLYSSFNLKSQTDEAYISRLKSQLNPSKTFFQVQTNNLIGKEYIKGEKYKEAKPFLQKSEKLATELNYSQGLAECFTYLGLVKAYYDERPDEAFLYHEKAYQIYKQLYETNKIKEEVIVDFLNNYAIDLYEKIKQKDIKKRRYRKAVDAFVKLQSEFKQYITLIATKKEISEKENTIKAKESTIKEKENTISSKSRELMSKQMALKNEILEKAKLTGKLEASELEKMRLQDSIMAKNYELAIQEIHNEKLLKDKAIKEAKVKEHEAEIKQNRLWLIIFGAGIFSMIVLASLIFIGLKNQRKANALLQAKNTEILQQKEEIQQQSEEILAQRDSLEQKTISLVAEQKKSQELLANILPAHVIEELKEKGYSQPHSYNNVSVIFTDFKGFTKLASKMTAENVVKELNVCFEKFDEIMEKYNLDKIKTIGDGYMAAGGFFNSERQAVQAVEACLEMLEFMEEIKNEKISKGEPVWELRVGIHTGPVVAGVIGKKKFAYDIWGDTVNLASRMESSGMAGKLNISEATYELVKDHFECTPRGKIEAKNAGEIEMFFVERKKSEKFLEKNLEF